MIAFHGFILRHNEKHCSLEQVMLSVWHKADIYRIPIYAPVTGNFLCGVMVFVMPMRRMCLVRSNSFFCRNMILTSLVCAHCLS